MYSLTLIEYLIKGDLDRMKMAITLQHACIPIVKFYDPVSILCWCKLKMFILSDRKMGYDLSVYNPVAVRDMELFKTYWRFTRTISLSWNMRHRLASLSAYSGVWLVGSTLIQPQVIYFRTNPRK
jgi:hypothetical protein